jgi:AraC-like DNA-binding protein/ligand-binding sensor protein
MKNQISTGEIPQLLKEIEKIARQGAVYHSLYDSQMQLSGSVCTFCKQALAHPAASSLCRAGCCNGIMQAMAAGEPYYFRCWANLLVVVVPVAPHNKCIGGFALGGFCISGEKTDIRSTVLQIARSWPEAYPANFIKQLNSIRPTTPRSLRGLGALMMEITFSHGLNSSEFFKKQNEKYIQQRRIAEAAAEVRAESAATQDIPGDSSELASFLNQAKKQDTQTFTSRYLARLLLASNWNQLKLKAHLRVLLAVITSHDILRGTPWAVATSREMRNMVRLEQTQTTEESCYEVNVWFQDYFARQNSITRDGRSLSERVTHWLQSHYPEKVTLASTAKALGVSSSTLVHRLQLESGKSFKTILTEIRISEAKKFLATTSLDISGIGNTCGFFDQSHFTREFKRAINLTPGAFRRLLKVSDEALKEPAGGNLDETALLRKKMKAVN